MAETTKEQTEIEIEIKHHLEQQQRRLSVDLGAEQQRVPFFGQRRENTWVISLFVMLHLVAFSATMIVNDCWRNSHGDCALRPLGRLSFQPLSENPLLGPSASTLDEMGALRLTLFEKHHETWRLFTSPWLHAGVFHLIISLSSVLFVGIHLEQEFGPLRIGIIYTVSALVGTLVAALFLQDRPSVSSSGALLGLLGAMLSGLIQNWKFYSKKFAAIVVFSLISAVNLVLGLLPYVNNFSNIGGFIAGFVLGFVLLFKPQLGQMVETKGGLFEYDIKGSVKVKLRQKLDRPMLRSVSLVLFILLVAGGTITVFHGMNVNKYCSWCRYLDCVPFKWWSCNDRPMHCQTTVSSGRLTLTCTGSDKFRVFPFTDISQTRIEDLCTLICSN